MAKTNDSEVKTLIMGANLALEAHKFDKAKSICEQALKLDDNNPNIYLILLLARYKVTEIEHLEKCNVDYESDVYKNVRRYAGKELNDELNRYLSDKKDFVANKTSGLNFKQSFEKFKPNLKNIFIKVKDFYLDKKSEPSGKKENDSLFNVKKSTKGKKNLEKYSSQDNTIANFLTVDLTSSFKDTVYSLSYFIFILSLVGVLFFLFFITLGCLFDFRVFSLISIAIIDISLFLVLKKAFNRDFDLDYKPDTSKFTLLGKSLLNLILAIILVFIIYLLYFYAGKFAVQNLLLGIIGVFLGFMGSYLVFLHYRCVYGFIKYVDIILKSFNSSSSR